MWILKELFNISNKKEAPVQPVLSLRLGDRHLAYSITNGSGEELYQLGYYRTEEADATDFSGLLEQVPALKESFYQVQVAYDYNTSTLVPMLQFPAEEAGSLLKSLFGPNGNEAVVTETLAEWQLHNVYTVPAGILQLIRQQYPAARSRHQFSLGLHKLNAAGEQGLMLVDFRQDDFTVLLGRSGKLLLAQTYGYATPEDVLYYMVKICNQLSLSRQETTLQLSGLIDPESALYKELSQYFLQLEFRSGNWPETGFPDHFFTVLNDLARCAS